MIPFVEFHSKGRWETCSLPHTASFQYSSPTLFLYLDLKTALYGMKPYKFGASFCRFNNQMKCNYIFKTFVFKNCGKVLIIKQGKKVCKATALRSCHCFPCTMLSVLSTANWSPPEKKSYSAQLLTAAEGCKKLLFHVSSTTQCLCSSS